MFVVRIRQWIERYAGRTYAQPMINHKFGVIQAARPFLGSNITAGVQSYIAWTSPTATLKEREGLQSFHPAAQTTTSVVSS